jgi:hypothetical protein
VRLSYQSLHWGTAPDRQDTMKAAMGSASPEAGLVACSYVTKKADKAEIFRHEFEAHEGRKPRLLRVGKGSLTVEAPPQDTLAIGRAIDLETTSERVLLGAGCYFATDSEGEAVYLVSKHALAYAIEQRGTFVTNRGIEG